MGKNYPSMRNVRKIRPSRKTSAYNCVKLTDDMADMDDDYYPNELVKKGLAESVNQEAIYKHKTYCPLYKHKDTCPALLILKETNHKGHKKNDDEDPAEASTGLPKLKLGPCPIMGRPCMKPNFSKLFKNVEPPLPLSHSDAGKICCSKELKRIKKMLKEFTTIKKDDDLRCVNKFFRDTDGRCCDDDHIICALKGEECCAIHKLNIKTIPI